MSERRSRFLLEAKGPCVRLVMRTYIPELLNVMCLFVGGWSWSQCLGLCACVLGEGGEGEAAEKGDGMSRTWTEGMAVKGGGGRVGGAERGGAGGGGSGGLRR